MSKRTLFSLNSKQTNKGKGIYLRVVLLLKPLKGIRIFGINYFF